MLDAGTGLRANEYEPVDFGAICNGEILSCCQQDFLCLSKDDENVAKRRARID
jgi:hypothetical protein